MKKTMMTQKYPKLINVGSLIRSVVGKKFPKLINVGCTFIRNARVHTMFVSVHTNKNKYIPYYLAISF